MSSTAVSALPRCVALRSKHDNKSYLRAVHDENHGGSVIELGGDGDAGITNPRCRFYLEPSKKHEGLVHVRCCYNNKYWVPQQHGGGSARWVIGTAHEPEEDLSKPECTLHKIIPIAGDGEQAEEDGSTTCRFLHSKLGKYACVSSTPTPVRSYMHIASHEAEADRQDGDLIDAFIVIDGSGQKKLPLYLAFKGDNGCFLAAQDDTTLTFSGTDIADKRVLQAIYTNHDDHRVVRIQSKFPYNFWSNDGVSPSNFIGTTASYDDNDPNTFFKVTTWDDFIALRNLGNNKFCIRLTDNWRTNYLSAAADSITTEARLQYYEPVLSRDIYNVDFRLSEARMYTKGIDDLHSQTVKNQTSTPNKTTLTFTYKKTVMTCWTSTNSIKTGIKTNLVAKVPLFADGKIELSAEYSGSWTWGKTETEQKLTSKQITIDVPPMKKVTVNAIGSNGVCDIPFSYTQRDILFNGQEEVQKFTDGLYVGVKTTNITFETIEEDL